METLGRLAEQQGPLPEVGSRSRYGSWSADAMRVMYPPVSTQPSAASRLASESWPEMLGRHVTQVTDVTDVTAEVSAGV